MRRRWPTGGCRKKKEVKCLANEKFNNKENSNERKEGTKT
jgi:hypothetical protein